LRIRKGGESFRRKMVPNGGESGGDARIGGKESRANGGKGKDPGG